MSYHTFYDPNLSAAAGETITLDGAEGRHATQVRRVRIGEVIDVVDGRGIRMRAEVVEVGKGELDARVLDVMTEHGPTVSITLVQALGKGGRDEAAIEAATELGVDAVIAWESERSVSKWRGEKVDKGLQRWESIITGAMKQSRRARMPEVRGYARGTEVVELISAEATVLVLHESATEPISQVALPASGEIVIVVGPEGGLSDTEVELLTEGESRHAVLLGREVVRTSTAGPAAMAVLNTRLGRW